MPDGSHLDTWSAFLTSWSLDRLRTMTLQEYTNLDRKDALVYWLEKRTETLGSIWGGAAFKWGIYARANKTPHEDGNGLCWRDDYAWESRLGETVEEAFTAVKQRIITVAEAAAAGNYAAIDAVGMLWPVVKWKIAFLYQDRGHPGVVPLFKAECLKFHYRKLNPASKGSAQTSIVYRDLLERHVGTDLLALSRQLWRDWVKARVRAWAVPLSPAMAAADADALCQTPQAGIANLPPTLAELVRVADMGEGDQIAFLIGNRVRALGTVRPEGNDETTWTLAPADIPYPGSLPIKVKALDDAMRKVVWSGKRPAQAWKIAPGRGAEYWPAWRDGGYASIGSPELNDLTGVTKDEFTVRVKEAAAVEPDEFKGGARQVWDFSQMAPGDLLIANQGMRKVLGIGRVTGPYYFDPNHEYPHRLPIEWFDVRPRAVNKPGWVGALIRVNPTDYESILHDVSPVRVAPAPTNRVLFGPPGTGKTYATVDEALALVDGDSAPIERADRVARFRQLQKQGRVEFVTFHQSYGYEDFVEGIRPRIAADATGQVEYELHKGIFLRIALRAAGAGLKPTAVDDQQRTLAALNDGTFEFGDDTPQFVLVIDEINRGNISRILGELITLLEPDKRLGAPNEVKVRLASSPDQFFGVPPNLHIVATMNTADRSIALLDVALRRRFQFRELLPDGAALARMLDEAGATGEHIALVCAVFDQLNERIRFLHDRDHQLGHALFSTAVDEKALRDVFMQTVIPMLQEYFYGAWDRVCMALGCPYDEAGAPRRKGEPGLLAESKSYLAPIFRVQVIHERDVLGFDHPEHDNGLICQIDERFVTTNESDTLRRYFEALLSTKRLQALQSATANS